MGVESGHRDTRYAAQNRTQGGVGDAYGFQHRRFSHGLDGLAQGQVDADQHGAQFLVGQHHAHRQKRHRNTRMPGGQRLQDLGMTGKTIKRRARCGQALFVKWRGHHCGDCPIKRLLRGPLHTAAGKLARHRADLAVGHRLHGRAHLQYRNTAGRQMQGLLRIADLHYRPGQSWGPLGHQSAGTAHGLKVTSHKTSLHLPGLGGIGLGNNFRADSSRIAHGDGQGFGRKSRLRHGWSLQAGLSTSMNSCAMPNCCATCPATAGAP